MVTAEITTRVGYEPLPLSPRVYFYHTLQAEISACNEVDHPLSGNYEIDL